ncbi:glycosylphosphatidylinositol anchor biosynthesis [Umbelopsis sp. WA50703]
MSLGLYTTTTHQRGVMDAVEWIRMEAMDLRRNNTEYDMEVAFLMPCHSTPWQSVIHDNNVKAWFLTCEPPLAKYAEDYKDEADEFYDDPSTYIKDRILPTSSRKSPSQIIAFDSLLQMQSQDNETIGDLLQDRGGYIECQRFFNSHFHDDWRRTGDVIILCHADNQE